ncbi:sodium-dependent transporter [Sulfuricurvum sp.]|uniref:sodium-dependent transporter n=1 Tax=Sulfuricurvum sp. TaxID=2025608 RepID=UPI0019B3E9AD|nr:sodium-dependent transporter [Sulfuricurvum sp.]MBD3799720.1 sodium-dependent transporter [Campylobacterota bacterium]MBD3806950.1 sodium-dependent transporter [Sulfuricurvum sp.]
MKIAHFSRWGFLMAAVGSAVGLGNIWKFPYITGEYGGGAFVLVYLLTVVLVGFSVMIAEMLIGYLGRRDGVGAFEDLAPRHKERWKYAGFMGLSGTLVMFYYSVVIGWIFYYITLSFGTLPATIPEAEGIYNHLMTQGIGVQIFFHTLSFMIVTAVLVRGIKGGIERFNLILMPALMLIIAGMLVYVMNLENFSKALSYMFVPDWGRLTSEAFAVAVGHAFFTLSLGMGAIMIYSASLEKSSNLVRASIFVIITDTLIALAAGLVLFTLLFQYGAEPAKGPGLVFISLPSVFHAMGLVGNVLAVLFFLALAFAGLTSSVSLVEPMIQYLIDRWNMSRIKAAVSMGLFFYVFGIVAIFSLNTDTASYLTWGGKNFFDWVDYMTSNVLLPLAGLIMAIFVGYVVEKERVASVLQEQMGWFYPIWRCSVRYIAPVALFVVMLNLMGLIEF